MAIQKIYRVVRVDLEEKRLDIVYKYYYPTEEKAMAVIDRLVGDDLEKLHYKEIKLKESKRVRVYSPMVYTVKVVRQTYESVHRDYHTYGIIEDEMEL